MPVILLQEAAVTPVGSAVKCLKDESHSLILEVVRLSRPRSVDLLCQRPTLYKNLNKRPLCEKGVSVRTHHFPITANYHIATTPH